MKKSRPTLDSMVRGGWCSRRNLPVSPAFGVEVELENVIMHPIDQRYWMTKGEPSLRNHGVEFVSKPIPFDERHDALQDFEELLKLSTTPPQRTIRCSTHIHLNVSYLTLRKVIHALVAYYLLENLLVRTQTAHREGNLFCLRLSDAEAIGNNLKELIRNPRPNLFDPDQVKYSAVNIAPLRRFGTIEFRFLSPMTTAKDILFWVEALQRFLEFAQTVRNSTEILSLYDALPIEDFFEAVFGNRGQEMYQRVREKFPGNAGYAALTKAIHQNYDILQEIARLETTAKFEVSPSFWNPDIVTGDVDGIEGIWWDSPPEPHFEDTIEETF